MSSITVNTTSGRDDSAEARNEQQQLARIAKSAVEWAHFGASDVTLGFESRRCWRRAAVTAID
jgi:hypothetical protein